MLFAACAAGAADADCAAEAACEAGAPEVALPVEELLPRQAVSSVAPRTDASTARALRAENF